MPSHPSPCLDESTVVALLDGALAGPSLDAVHSHVDGCASCRQLLAQVGRAASPSGSPSPFPSPSTSPLAGLGPGAHLGRYVILERVGTGGMGHVYAAYDPELHRKVAVKVLRPERLGALDWVEASARLQREAQAIARLSHPHVVTVHDVGLLGDEVFIAMEYVEGHTLDAWLRESPRPWRQVLALLRDAGRGLAAAHAAGLVHRDFKPGNVLVGRDGRVRVTDFGLARSATPSPTPPLPEGVPAPGAALDVPLTLTGTLQGTPAYMAPEQLRGQTADALSDQFSFCVALYEALYGERPFTGDSLSTLAASVTGGQVRPAPKGTQVPDWLRRLLLRGLAVRPSERFPTLEALLEALGRDPSARRRRWLAVGAGVTALGLTASVPQLRAEYERRQCAQEARRLADVWLPEARAQAQAAFLATGRSFAEASFTHATEAIDAYLSRWTERHADACEATHVRHEQAPTVLDARQACLARRLGAVKALTKLFSTADGQVVERAVQATVSLPDLDACAAVTLPPAGAPASVDVEKAQALRTRIEEANALQVTGKYAQALPLVQQNLADARAMKDRGLEYEALRALASHHQVTQALADAERTLHQALQVAQASRDDRGVAQSAVTLVSVLGEVPRLEQAHQWAGFARAAIERLGGSAPLEAELDTALGITLFSERRFPEALEAQQRALAQYEALYGPEHVHLAGVVNGLAGTLMELNRFDEALAMEERSIRLMERNVGMEHPSLSNALNNLAAILALSGKPAEGIPHLQRAIAVTEKALGPEHYNVATSLGQLALLYQALGRMPEGLPLMERQLAILEKSLGPEDPGLVLPLSNLCSFLSVVGRHAEALAVSQRAVRIAEKSYGPDSPHLMLPLSGLTAMLINLKRPAEALPHAERVLAAADAPGAYRGMRTAARVYVASVLTALGREPSRARKLGEEAVAIAREGGPETQAEAEQLQSWLARGMPVE